MLLGVVLLLVLASLVFSALREPVYEAEAVVEILPQGSLGVGQDPEVFLEEVVGAVNTSDLRQEAIARSGWPHGERRFRQQLNLQPFVQQGSEEIVLAVRLTGSEPEATTLAANAYAALFVERVNQLSDRLAGGALAAEAGMQSLATTPESSFLPRAVTYALVATGVGVVVGGAGALLLESRDRNWRGARDAELTLRAPVLGVIPDYSPEEGEV